MAPTPRRPLQTNKSSQLGLLTIQHRPTAIFLETIGGHVDRLLTAIRRNPAKFDIAVPSGTHLGEMIRWPVAMTNLTTVTDRSF